jgi:hypothetical protein
LPKSPAYIFAIEHSQIAIANLAISDRQIAIAYLAMKER